MRYVQNFFIVIGLFLVSQVSMITFTVVKTFFLATGADKLNGIVVLFLLFFILGNIWLMIFLSKRLGFWSVKTATFNKKNIALIVAGFFLARVIAIGGTLLLNNNGVTSTANDETIQKIFIGENPYLIILLVGIAAPIMEEIVFRGGIIGFWLKSFPIVGVAVSSIVFGLVHSPTDMISFFMYGLMGLVLSVAYYKTQRLEVSIAIHFLNNILPAIVLALM